MATLDELVEQKTRLVGHTRGDIAHEHYWIRPLPEYALRNDIYYCGKQILYPGTKVSFQILKAKDGEFFASDVELVVN